MKINSGEKLNAPGCVDRKIHYARCRLCGKLIEIDSPVGDYSLSWYVSEGGQFRTGIHEHGNGSVGLTDYVGYKIVNPKSGIDDKSTECINVIREELLKHGELYKGFHSSILSVLKPKEKYVGDGCFEIQLLDSDACILAEEILKRIIGEE